MYLNSVVAVAAVTGDLGQKKIKLKFIKVKI